MQALVSPIYMKNIAKLIFLSLLIIFACNSNSSSSKDSEAIVAEINSLNSTVKQSTFLSKIGDLDQEVRHQARHALETFGNDSPEHKEAIQHMMQTDLLNEKKIECYLNIHGHPSLSNHGKNACGVPWIVLHHSPNDVEVRERNFKHLYQAYKAGDLEDSALSFYLNRMHYIKFNKRLDWDRPFKPEEELDSLMILLELAH